MLAEEKSAKIRDIIRRCVANPENIPDAAYEIALDWHPTIVVKLDGSYDFVIGSGKKR
jgi:hypothetical protein